MRKERKSECPKRYFFFSFVRIEINRWEEKSGFIGINHGVLVGRGLVQCQKLKEWLSLKGSPFGRAPRSGERDFDRKITFLCKFVWKYALSVTASRATVYCGSVTLGIWKPFRLSFNTLAPLRYPKWEALFVLSKNKILINVLSSWHCSKPAPYG